MRTMWAAKWEQTNRLDGRTKFLILWDQGQPTLFATRKECRQWITKHYGYIKTRKDLRVEPHCWRVPRAVRVKTIEIR